MISKILVVGNGAVGSALAKFLRTKFKDVTTWDCLDSALPKEREFDIVHITIPFTAWEQYLSAMVNIVSQFTMKRIIVHSTIVVGIMTKLKEMRPDMEIYYSPIRCQEAKMDKEIRELDMLIAPHPSEFIYDTLGKIINLVYWNNPEDLVMAKLLEVAWFGMNLAFVQQAKLICQANDLDFDETYTNYNGWARIGKDYRRKELHYIPRPTFVPGYIGGKCVIPDVQLMKLMKYGDPRLWDWIIDTNEYFRGEKHD